MSAVVTSEFALSATFRRPAPRERFVFNNDEKLSHNRTTRRSHFVRRYVCLYFSSSLFFSLLSTPRVNYRRRDRFWEESARRVVATVCVVFTTLAEAI